MAVSSLKNKYLDKISITVEDLQTSSLSLIYNTEFSDVNLRIGDNILSQFWQPKKFTTRYFSDKNHFRYIYVFYTHPSADTPTHPPTHTRTHTHARARSCIIGY